jgi:hypothetical protein
LGISIHDLRVETYAQRGEKYVKPEPPEPPSKSDWERMSEWQNMIP